MDNGEEFHDKGYPFLRLHIDGTVAYLSQMLEELSVTMRRVFRAFGCLFYAHLEFIQRDRGEGNWRKTACVVRPRAVKMMRRIQPDRCGFKGL